MTTRRAHIGLNAIGNLLGNAWAAALGLLFPPIFARWMGIEAYGLVGFYASLAAVLPMLDLGLSMTLSREVAALSSRATPEARRESADLLRTFEFVYLPLGVAFGAVVALGAPLIARWWIHPASLTVDTVTRCLVLMGLTLAVQCSQNAYVGVLGGLQRQLLLNAVQASSTTIRTIGALAALYWFGSDPTYFFVSQLVVNTITILVLSRVARSALPTDARPRFRRSLLAKHAGFAAGMWALTLVVVILTQVDKLVVSRLLPLELFGYYTLAVIATNAIQFLNTPIYNAAFPRLTQLSEAGDIDGLRRVYRVATQGTVILVAPVALVIAVFAHEVVAAWTQDSETADIIGASVSIRALAIGAFCVSYMPSGLLTAQKKVRPNVVVHACALALFVPVETILVREMGIVGASWGWLALVAFQLPMLSYAAQGLYSRGEWVRWLFRDVLAPASAAAAVVGLAKGFMVMSAARGILLAQVALVVGMALVAAALAATDARGFVVMVTRRWASALRQPPGRA